MSGQSVAIKALEFTQWAGSKGWQVNTILGQYQVSWLGSEECWQLYTPAHGEDWDKRFTFHSSSAEAKAAAMKDYETRILSALSVPPEIEGGDKGDGWQKAVGWFFRNNAGDPWQFSTAEPEICYEKHRAYSDAQPIPEAVRYAERLAASLWEKHWKDDAPQWEPLPGDLIGVLTQIDNMTAGLTRKGDGWQPMSTAPTDGKHCILAVKEGPFIYSVQGAFQAGEWNVVHRDNVKPLAWMPNVRLPDEFRPAAPSASIEGETNV